MINTPKLAHASYEAMVPDTLDLVERAEFGLNHFTSMKSEEHHNECYRSVYGDSYPKDIMEYVGKPEWEHCLRSAD